MTFLVGEVIHETNTFSNLPTGQSQFQERLLCYGDAVHQWYEGTRTSIGGFIDEAQRQGIDLFYAAAAFASPSGRVDGKFYKQLVEKLLAAWNDNFDGVLLSLHGAMVVEDIDDGEGRLLQLFRERIGPDKQIVATLDLHANLSETMVNNANLLVSNKTYPHIDSYERGVEAARMAIAATRGDIHPSSALEKPAILPPICSGSTIRSPMRDILERVREMEQRESVLTVSVNPGFPYADINDAGLSVYVATDGRPNLARECAKDLADLSWNLRHQFRLDAVPINQAVKMAMKSSAFPVVLADVADNPGAGGAGDSTAILRELLKQQVKSAAIGTIRDPEAVRLLYSTGVGRRVTVRIGGKTDRFHGDPIDVDGVVRALSDGEFVYKGPMFTGVTGHLGPTALLEVNGVHIILNTNRIQTWDPEVFRTVGVEPADYKILVVKSSVHYRSAFQPLAEKIIEVDAPGLVAGDLKKLPYKFVRRPIFPLDDKAGPPNDLQGTDTGT